MWARATSPRALATQPGTMVATEQTTMAMVCPQTMGAHHPPTGNHQNQQAPVIMYVKDISLVKLKYMTIEQTQILMRNKAYLQSQ